MYLSFQHLGDRGRRFTVSVSQVGPYREFRGGKEEEERKGGKKGRQEEERK